MDNQISQSVITKGLSVADLSPHFACTPTTNFVGPTWILSAPRWANVSPTCLAVWAFSHPCRVVLQASSMCTRCIVSGSPATITTSAICVGWARCPSSHILSANSTSSTTSWVCIFVNSLAPGRFEWNFSNYTLRFNEVERGVYWFHVICPSVCGQNRVRSVSSTILAGSISYLRILSSNFRGCVACKGYCKIWIFGQSLEFVTLTLSCYDVGSDMNP